MRRLKICSVALLPALKPACSSAMIFSACSFSLFSMILSMTLLDWLMRLIDYTHCGHGNILQQVFRHAFRKIFSGALRVPPAPSPQPPSSSPPPGPKRCWYQLVLRPPCQLEEDKVASIDATTRTVQFVDLTLLNAGLAQLEQSSR